MEASLAVEITSFIAGLLTTSGYFPQLYKIWRERDVRSISLKTFVILFLGLTMWFVVGVLLSSIAMMFWNGVSMAFALSIITLKIYLDNNQNSDGGNWRQHNERP